MTLLDLDVPFADTCAASLRWSLDAERRHGLARRAFRVGAHQVDVRVLGASHQVVATLASGAEVGEVVACDADGSPLPGAVERLLDRAGYALAVEVLPFTTTAMDAIAASVGRSRWSLGATFPGERGALTAIVVEALDDGVAWRTWHAYPQAGEVVATRTTLVAR